MKDTAEPNGEKSDVLVIDLPWPLFFVVWKVSRAFRRARIALRRMRR